MSISIHPGVDGGIAKGADGFTGGTLRCLCSQDPVEVKIDAQVAFNHACGCTKCWKPKGALFSVVGVVPRDKVSVTAHPEKLEIVDDVEVKLRYRGAPVAARVVADAEGFALDLAEPVDAVAPGQVAVLYDGDVVVGAGVIEAATG